MYMEEMQDLNMIYSFFMTEKFIWSQLFSSMQPSKVGDDGKTPLPFST